MLSGGAEIGLSDGRMVALRPATEDDYEELLRVYASTRAGELAQVTWWDDAQKLAFCRMQYDSQKSEYEANYPNCDYNVILLDGRTAGRIWVSRDDEEIHLLDIALLPEAQKQGIGAALVGALIEEARATGKRLRHMVFVMNTDALRFYERLGFQVYEDLGAYKHMRWLPDAEQAEAAHLK
jgi:ribosomal protein S18 acetylase RimI-like enzyme